MTKAQLAGTNFEYTIHRVPPEAVGHAWRTIEHWVREALEHGHGEYLAEDLLAALCAGNMYLLICLHGVEVVGMAITEVHQWPRKRALHVVVCGGKRPSKEYNELFVLKFEEGARNIGADFITVMCWPAMARFLRPLGFHSWYLTVGKELTNESIH